MKRSNDIRMSEYTARCQKYEDDELVPYNKLTSANYAELMLYYLVQQRLLEAKFCYSRAGHRKLCDDILEELWKIYLDLSHGNFGKALKSCRALKLDDKLQPYAVELKKRLIAIQLKLIAKCYSYIDKTSLGQMLGLSDCNEDADEAAEIFVTLTEKCGWRTEDNYVLPVASTVFHETVESLINVTDFGEIQLRDESNNDVKRASGLNGYNIDSLKALVEVVEA